MNFTSTQQLRKSFILMGDLEPEPTSLPNEGSFRMLNLDNQPDIARVPEPPSYGFGLMGRRSNGSLTNSITNTPQKKRLLKAYIKE